MNEKRGLSRKHSIIAIIIILVIIIGIIIGLVIAIKKGGSTNKSLISKVELDLDIKGVKVETDTSAAIKVKRGEGSGDLIGFEFTFDDGTQTEIIQVNYFLDEFQEEEFILDLQNINPNNIQSVKIAPIIESEDGGFFIGAVRDEYKIRKNNVFGKQNNNDNNKEYNKNQDNNSQDSFCNDNCSSLGFQCGTQTICGLTTNCGNCSSFGEGFVCSGSVCVQQSTCQDNCSFLNYECGNWTICGSEVNCGTCGLGFVCNEFGTCQQEQTCFDTCQDFNYECGNFTICNQLKNCGICGEGFVCNSSGICIEEQTCFDTCQDFNYECNTHSICGVNVNCGTCGQGFFCNVSGMCEQECTDTCQSLGYECGSQLICGQSTNCGTCSDGNSCTSDSCNAGTCVFNAICGSDGICCASQGCSDDPDCAHSWETGMVSWWSFNTNANDNVGSNDGSVYGATHTSSGCKSSGCYDFDGIDDYIDVGTFSVSGDKITISAWVSYEGSTYAVDPRIIAKAHGTEVSEHVFLLGLDDTSSTTAQYRFRFTAGGSTLNYIAGSATPQNGWKHIVSVYDGSNAKIYVDKILVGSTSKTGSLQTNSDSVYIGKNPVTDPDGGRYWNGKLDEIMIWNRALNSTEINDLFNAF